MIKVQIDNILVQELLKEAIETKINKHSNELLFWDSNELKRRTCMSWNSIQDNFFHDKYFQKRNLEANVLPCKGGRGISIKVVER